jgi:hypothetical protein
MSMSTISSVTTSGAAVAGALCAEKDGQHSQSAQLLPESVGTMAMSELARLRSEFGVNVWVRSERQRARYRVLGRRWGARRIHLVLNNEDEVDTKARQLATVPGQAPVVVIDTDDCSSVAFYFADGRVCLVVRKPRRPTEF